MEAKQVFIQQLVEKEETKLSLSDFFKRIHATFYPSQDISFMDYFLELTLHEGEFIVHHEKLIEYGIVTSSRSNDIKDKLDALELIENKDYNLRDIPQVRSQRGAVIKLYTC